MNRPYCYSQSLISFIKIINPMLVNVILVWDLYISNGLILTDHLTVVASNSSYLSCSTELLNQLYFHNAQWRCHIKVPVHCIVSHRSWSTLLCYKQIVSLNWNARILARDILRRADCAVALHYRHEECMCMKHLLSVWM